MKRAIFVGEMRVSEKGLVHQPDLAAALGVERTTVYPKEGKPDVIVGRLLGGRKTAILAHAESHGTNIVTVESVLTDEVRGKLAAMLTAKPHPAPYERQVLPTARTCSDSGGLKMLMA